jgi:hypothetical protein
MVVLYSEFYKKLLLHPGIIHAEILTEDILERVRQIEASFPHFGVTVVDPVGLHEIEKKGLKLILFCNDDFPMFTDHFMNFIDSSGSLIGHDVLPSEKHKYDNPNYVWLTDHIFMDLTRLGDCYTKCVLSSMPLKVNGLPKGVEPIVYYPCLETVELINTRYKEGRNAIATVLVGVDGVEINSPNR